MRILFKFYCVIILFIVINVGCNNENELDLKYLNQINFIDEYTYYDLSDFKNIEKDTVVLSEWFPEEKREKSPIQSIGDIEEIDDHNIWISDTMQGKIIQVDKDGNFIANIITRGRGPNELLSPALIASSLANNELDIYVLDTDLKSLLVFDRNGAERRRYSNKYIPNAITANNMHIINDNEYIWPSVQNEDYALVKWDSTGTIKEGLIKRIIPQGYQPSSHNSLVFDIHSENDHMVYSFVGLPLLFSEKDNSKKVVNLMPDKELMEFNTPLDFLPFEERISIKRIVRSIHISNDKILLSLESELYIIPNSFEETIQIYNFVDNNGEEILYHSLRMTGGKLFLINLYNSKIHTVELDKLNMN
jgi:hypothetical protein